MFYKLELRPSKVWRLGEKNLGSSSEVRFSTGPVEWFLLGVWIF